MEGLDANQVTGIVWSEISKILYVKICPECGTLSHMIRIDPFQTTNKTTKFRCLNCLALLEESISLTKIAPKKEIR